MCELRFYRCACGGRWTAHKKLSSCDNPDAASRCPESLCMYVGSARRPQERECDDCKLVRELLEGFVEIDAPREDGGLIPGDSFWTTKYEQRG